MKKGDPREGRHVGLKSAAQSPERLLFRTVRESFQLIRLLERMVLVTKTSRDLGMALIVAVSVDESRVLEVVLAPESAR